MGKRARKIAIRSLFVLGSLVVSLALLEVTLRLFIPRFQYAAESALDFDSLPIWSRSPDTTVERKHPDTGETQTVDYNNLGLRQGRDVPDEEIRDNVVISFFGDSLTENSQMNDPFVFSEVLDFRCRG